MSEQSASPPTQAAQPRTQVDRKARPSRPAPKPQRRDLPLFHVVLINDDDHSYDYVIEMLGRIFGHPKQKGFLLAQEVDFTGKCIVMTTHRELAELKRDQIQAYGSDPRSSQCAGSMSARIEAAR